MCEYCGNLFRDYDDVVEMSGFMVHRECLKQEEAIEATAGDEVEGGS